MHNALHIALDIPQRNAEVGAILTQRAHLRRGVGGPQGNVYVARGNGVVHGGECAIGAAHSQATLAQCGKRLGRCHLMDQVRVNIKHSGRALILRDNVRIPDFFKKCFRHACPQCVNACVRSTHGAIR